MSSFLSIENKIESILFKEKGSKFLGFAYPVSNLEGVKSSLEILKSVHPNATHHCYAYRFGLNGENYKINDDGEPSGSAGYPIYNQILSKDLTNILLVVVRYYGGTKLGVSGLIKAYKTCASETIKQGKIVETFLQKRLRFRFDYAQQAQITKILKIYDAEILESIYTEDCAFLIQVKETDFENLKTHLEQVKSIEVFNAKNQ